MSNTNTPALPDERAEFEAAFLVVKKNGCLARRENGDYVEQAPADAWKLWQMRAALAAEPAAWAVYWGIGEKRRNSVHFERATAEAVAASIKSVTEIRPLYAAAPAAVAEPAKWEGAEEWMPLAWELCANECGEDACESLIWEGGPVAEPWGERWLKYEDQAKEMIALVRKHVPAQPAPVVAADLTERAVAEAAWRVLQEIEDECDKGIDDLHPEHHVFGIARAVIAAMQDKQPGEPG